jgi:hypothetical protein
VSLIGGLPQQPLSAFFSSFRSLDHTAPLDAKGTEGALSGVLARDNLSVEPFRPREPFSSDAVQQAWCPVYLEPGRMNIADVASCGHTLLCLFALLATVFIRIQSGGQICGHLCGLIHDGLGSTWKTRLGHREGYAWERL